MGAKHELLWARYPQSFKYNHELAHLLLRGPHPGQWLSSFSKQRVLLLMSLLRPPQEEQRLGAEMQRVCTPSMCFRVPTLHCLLK